MTALQELNVEILHFSCVVEHGVPVIQSITIASQELNVDMVSSTTWQEQQRGTNHEGVEILEGILQILPRALPRLLLHPQDPGHPNHGHPDGEILLRGGPLRRRGAARGGREIWRRTRGWCDEEDEEEEEKMERRGLWPCLRWGG
jgi:hypothetical protein